MNRPWLTTSHYEWFVHKREGLEAGIAPGVIDAIATRRNPDLPDPRPASSTIAPALHRDHAVPEALSDAALGEAGVVELVGLLGSYTLVAMTLNAFDIGLPEGETSDLRA